MSTLKTNNVQIGQSGTATNNFVVAVPAVPDGTLKISRGNSGATTADIITVAANGAVSLEGDLVTPIITGGSLTNPIITGGSSTGTSLTDPVIKLNGSDGTVGQVPVAQGVGLPPVWGAVEGILSDYQEFTTSGTWTKPVGATWVYVEAIGGGGGGGNDLGFDEAGGGGGGAGVIKLLRATDCATNEPITIGAGGSGGVAGADSVGADGGATSFGDLVVANGGKGNTHSSVSSASLQLYGAGGGGEVGVFTSVSLVVGAGGFSSGAGGFGYSGGGSCFIGGAGGGGTTGTDSASGGVSQNGGNGGAGSLTAATQGGNGVAPGGGGGGSANDGGGGDGAPGRVRVWCW